MKIIQFILLHKQKDDQVIHRKSILIGGNCIGMSFIFFLYNHKFDSLFSISFLWFLPSNNLSRLWIILCYFCYFRNFWKKKMKNAMKFCMQKNMINLFRSHFQSTKNKSKISHTFVCFCCLSHWVLIWRCWI